MLLAKHFARIAEDEGARLYSLGTETDRLFRTRSGDPDNPNERDWTNNFGQELKVMVDRVRAVYSGLLTYDMHYSVLLDLEYFGPGSNHTGRWVMVVVVMVWGDVVMVVGDEDAVKRLVCGSRYPTENATRKRIDSRVGNHASVIQRQQQKHLHGRPQLNIFRPEPHDDKGKTKIEEMRTCYSLLLV